MDITVTKNRMGAWGQVQPLPRVRVQGNCAGAQAGHMAVKCTMAVQGYYFFVSIVTYISRNDYLLSRIFVLLIN